MDRKEYGLLACLVGLRFGWFQSRLPLLLYSSDFLNFLLAARRARTALYNNIQQLLHLFSFARWLLSNYLPHHITAFFSFFFF